MQDSAPQHIALHELLSPGRINLQLAGAQRDDVLNELIAQISELDGRPEARQTLLHALQEREKLHSTGIGDGIALPHARNGLVGLVDHPILVFGRHEGGVHYGSIDNAPAHLFFLLIAPTVNQHLAILARLSRILRNPKLRKDLLVADAPEKIIRLVRDGEAER